MRKGKRKARRLLQQVSQSFGDGILGMSDKLPFGMYAGQKVVQVLADHPEYLAWWEAHIHHPKLARSVAAVLPPFTPTPVLGYDEALEMYGMDAFEW